MQQGDENQVLRMKNSILGSKKNVSIFTSNERKPAKKDYIHGEQFSICKLIRRKKTRGQVALRYLASKGIVTIDLTREKLVDWDFAGRIHAESSSNICVSNQKNDQIIQAICTYRKSSVACAKNKDF